MSKIAIVTGGSSGIGYSVSEQLVLRSYRVYILARDADRGVTAAAQLSAAKPGAEVEFLHCDVRSIASVSSALAEVRSHAQRIDLLVNCAGILHRAMLGDVSEDAIDTQLDTCLKGTILVTGAAVELLAQAESALVVNVGSVAGRQPFESLSVYGAAKAGVIHFSRTAAKELYGRGIRVVCVNPGVVQTGLMPLAEFALVQGTLPGRRLQQPEEIGSFIANLADADYSSLTGSVIDLDDGAGLFTGAPPQMAEAPRPSATHLSSVAKESTVPEAVPARTEAGTEESADEVPSIAATVSNDDLTPKLAAVFERVFGLASSAVHPDLTPDDVFKWDSIGHIRLVGAIEEDLDVSFDVDEIMELTSFRAILEILRQKA